MTHCKGVGVGSPAHLVLPPGLPCHDVTNHQLASVKDGQREVQVVGEGGGVGCDGKLVFNWDDQKRPCQTLLPVQFLSLEDRLS